MRPIVLGNGAMLVAIDFNANIRDLYYPYVGEENHTGYPGFGIKMGVYEGEHGSFSWIDHNWKKEFLYIRDTLVSDIILTNERIGIRIRINSFVDHQMNAYIKRIVVENISPITKEFRIFIAHDYKIYESVIADTALYDPKGCIIHYKKDRYFLHASHPEFSQFATGKTDQGFLGTWKDAEDGVLSGNMVSQGNVDSVVGFTLLDMKPGMKKELYYWIGVGHSYDRVGKIHEKIKEKGPETLLKENIDYWRSWLKSPDMKGLSPKIEEIYRRSLLTIRTHADNKGAIIASCDSDIMQFNLDHYNYCWPRDAGWISIALDYAGFHEITRRFFKFCSRILNKNYFYHKYWPSGKEASTWHPMPSLQEDETAMVLFALYKHFQITKDTEFIQSLYENLIEPTADFLNEYLDGGFPKSSWDLWEERKDIHCYTVCSVIAGLEAGAELAKALGKNKYDQWKKTADRIKKNMDFLWSNEKNRYLRSLKDFRIDSSEAGLILFDVFKPDDEKVANTMQAIRNELWKGFGLARYVDDNYHGHMNVWPICTLFYAIWLIKKAKSRNELEEPGKIIESITELTTDSGLLAEQYDEHKYAKSVTPLAWSHAMFVIAVHEYLEKLRELKQ